MRVQPILKVAFVLFVIGGTLACRLWPRTLPPERCSELYQRYYTSSDIRASFIKDKIINDTVTADVTVLEAISDTGWTILQRDFNIPIIPKEYEAIFYGDSNHVTIRTINKKDPILPVDTVNKLNNNIMLTSRPKHFICIFTITDSIQILAISNYNYEYNLSNNTNKTTPILWLKNQKQSKR